MSAPVDAVVHTPGPWVYEPVGAMVFAEDGQAHVADVRDWGRLSRLHGDAKAAMVQDANGRLMAAAPEMLELLQEIVGSGVAFDDPRIDYMEVQIDRETIREARKLLMRLKVV